MHLCCKLQRLIAHLLHDRHLYAVLYENISQERRSQSDASIASRGSDQIPVSFDEQW